MYVLYSDESGELSNPDDKVIVVAGVAVHEEAVRPLAGAVNSTLARYVGRRNLGEFEIHGSPMRGGRKEWRPISQGKRLRLADELLDLIGDWTHRGSGSTVLPFAVVIDRTFSQSTIEVAYGELLFAFDEALRDRRRGGDGHNGILVGDRGKYERAISAWVEIARAWRSRPQQDPRRLYALVETPFFVDSKATRLMQLADLVSFSFFRAYQYSDWSWADRLMPAIKREEGKLLHLRSDDAPNCTCPACSPETTER